MRNDGTMTDVAGVRGVRAIGTVLVIAGCVLAVINHPWSWAVAGVFAGVGVGLRIEAAIRECRRGPL
jgi:hypothetical protein